MNHQYSERDARPEQVNDFDTPDLIAAPNVTPFLPCSNAARPASSADRHQRRAVDRGVNHIETPFEPGNVNRRQ